MLYRCTPHFEEAVMDMARSPKSLQARLVDAMHHLNSCDMPGSLPDDVMVEFKALWERTTAVDPETVDIAGEFKGEGRLTATCMTMSDAEAVEVAKTIVRLHMWLDELSRR